MHKKQAHQHDIAILGAGIMGLMAGYMLAEEHAVTIYDPKGFPANNASWMAGGMLAPYSEIEHMDMEWVEASIASIKILRELPINLDITNNGSLLIACPEDRHILERFKTHLPAEYQALEQAQKIEPALSNKFQYGLYLKDEAHLNPHTTMNALCNHLRHHPNVELITDPTFQHSNHPTLQTIDCRGMASNDSALRGVKGETLLVRNPEFHLSRPVRLMHPRYPLYIIPRGDGIFMIGATIIESNENTNVSLRSAMELQSALYALSSTFADAEILDIKAGIRPSYPDNLPRITVKDNTITANGLFRHGYLLAPIMAEVIRDHLAEQKHAFAHLFIKDENNESHHQRAA